MAGRFRRRLSEVDTVGVQDLVLLDQHLSEDAVRENLRKRFQSKLIYTYIGSVLLAVNPYEELDIYNEEFQRTYEGANMFELPPHIFAIADQAFRTMRDEQRDQCILISGESGAGKTESSKKILHFLAHCSSNIASANTIRDRLLRANPILEAFGNATTVLNDNSSRFGKYMEIQFDFKGEPLGGRILNYLLEKSRVVLQMSGERNFHIFYLLLSGADRLLLQRLHLQPSAGHYWYTRQGGNFGSPQDDAAQFHEVYNAFSHLGFRPEEIKALFEIVASVVHLGEISFDHAGEGHSVVKSREPVSFIAELLSLDAHALAECLTYQTITARGQSYRAHLSRDKAVYARDALAKAMYMRTFTWLVERLNQLLAGPDAGRLQVMGLLDIYGFEILRVNSFEQFCINYCNEKLQQLFIELTLKQEQEEYAREGIQWEPVQFFDNKIICDMVEEKHKGVVAILDEECLRPGDVSDETFLQRLDHNFARHRHYHSFGAAGNKDRKAHARGTFQISHYAGDVIYTIEGFLDKNNDLLFRDMKEVINRSGNPIAAALFPSEELLSLKRPPTAATQFKNSMNALIDILMKKTPWYVRCIKPNAAKKPSLFEHDLVRHQIKYLNLMENLRVRRAGFAYRRPFDIFLQRYKCLSPRTWPNYRGSSQEGTRALLQDLRIAPDEYRIGHTKVFIRTPATLFDVEARFQRQKHKVVATIQAHVRGRMQRKTFLGMKAAVVMIAKHWRRVAAQRRLQKLKQAYLELKLACIRWIRRRQRAYRVIENFVRGYKERNKPRSDANATFLNLARYHWLVALKAYLPPGILDHTWCPRPPPSLQQASTLLQKMHKRLQVRKYIRALKPERKAQLALKLTASELFKGKKQSYPASIAAPFVDDRMQPVLTQHPNYPRLQRLLAKFKDTAGIKYVTPVVKFDRSSGKPRERLVLLTPTTLYFLAAPTLALLFRLDLQHLKGASLSALSDTTVVLHTDQTDKKDKGDFMLAVPQPIEFATLLFVTSHKSCAVVVADSIAAARRRGHPVPLAFAVGENHAERKKGSLTVTAPAAPVPDHFTKHLAAVAERARALQRPPQPKRASAAAAAVPNPAKQSQPPKGKAAAALPASPLRAPAGPVASEDSTFYASIASPTSVASTMYEATPDSIYDTTEIVNPRAASVASSPSRPPPRVAAGPGPGPAAAPQKKSTASIVTASAQPVYGDEGVVRSDSLGNGIYGDDGSTDYVPPNQRKQPIPEHHQRGPASRKPVAGTFFAAPPSAGAAGAAAPPRSAGSSSSVMPSTSITPAASANGSRVSLNGHSRTAPALAPAPVPTAKAVRKMQAQPLYGDPDEHLYGEVGAPSSSSDEPVYGDVGEPVTMQQSAIYGQIDETYGF